MKQFLFVLTLIGLSLTTQAQQRKIIFFETGSTDLTEKAKASLDKLVYYGLDGTQVNLTTTSLATRNATNVEMNDLSRDRANAVATYLKDKGIVADHLALNTRAPMDPFRVYRSDGTEPLEWVVETTLNPVPGAPAKAKPSPVAAQHPLPGHSSLEELLDGPYSTSVDPTKDINIRCTQGTKLWFPANAFHTFGGELVEDDIEIEVREFYTKESLVKGSLSTMTAYGDMLESGGTLHIRAFIKKNGTQEELMYLHNTPYTIDFPLKKGYKEDMQWFDGNKNQDGDVVWATPSFEDFEEIYWEEDGYDMELATDEVKEYYDEVNRADSYLLEGTSLGWINCDRFYEEENKVDMMVNLEIQPIKAKTGGINTTVRPVVRVVFNDIQAVMPAYAQGNKKYGVNQVPANASVTVIAYAIVEKQPYFALTTTTVGSATPTVTLKQGTWDDFEKALKRLDS